MVQTLLSSRDTQRNAVSQIQTQKRQRDVLENARKRNEEERAKRLAAIERRWSNKPPRKKSRQNPLLERFYGKPQLMVPEKLRF